VWDRGKDRREETGSSMISPTISHMLVQQRQAEIAAHAAHNDRHERPEQVAAPRIRKRRLRRALLARIAEARS
jgi:hypothetical protein